VSFPSGPSFPAAGTITGYTALQEYPIANGGTYFSNPLGGGDVPNQNATFAIRADGTGGTYTDFSTTGTVSYKPYGIFATDTTGTALYVDISGSNYYIGNSYPAYAHDGYGSYSSTTSTIWFPYGTEVNSVSNQSEVPSSSGTYYNNGTSTSYRSDGSGSWYSTSAGNYYSSGVLIYQNITGQSGSYFEYPTGTYYYPENTGNRYTWNGGGGYNEQTTWFKPSGTLITTSPSVQAVPDTSSNYYNNGKTNSHYWDGTGSYYSIESGSFYSAGILIFENVTGTNNISMPSGSSVTGTYSGEKYTWNGSGGYNYLSVWYVPNGTFIEEYSGYNYYHDGAGHYYSVFI
jgi:hypothetical protein